MKKNAILIAGIMFVAGCATHQGGYGTASTGSSSSVIPSTASQYDSASADIRADSSIRGGSNEARGWRNYGRSDYETGSPHMNSPFQADSSIRGGSNEARGGRDYGRTDYQMNSPSINHRIEADSSIRGGSNEARGFERSNASKNDYQSEYRSNDTDMDMRSDLDVYRGGSQLTLNNQSASSMDSGTAANFNPSDDLLRDGLGSDQDHTAGALSFNHSDQVTVYPSDKGLTFATPQDAQASIEQASDSASGVSTSVDPTGKITSDEMNTEDVGGPGSSQTGSASSPQAYSRRDLERTENNECPDAAKSAESSGLKLDDEGVGGPAISQQGSQSSKSESRSLDQSDSASLNAPESQVGVTTDSENWLFRNNRAQGIGSGATGEFGVVNSTDSQLTSMSDEDLANKVKANLVKGSTGTFGITQTEARNIHVTANNGTVTLKGSVAGEKQKKMVEISANEVTGVKRVDNQLTVSPNANPASRDLGSGRNLEDTTLPYRDQEQD